MMAYRLNETLSVSIDNSNLQTILFPNIYELLNTMTIVLTLPLVNHILVPCIPSMSMRVILLQELMIRYDGISIE